VKDEYDFSKGIKNPYCGRILGRSVVVNLDKEIFEYYKNLAKSEGVEVQTLLNSLIADCARKQIKPSLSNLVRVTKEMN